MEKSKKVTVILYQLSKKKGVYVKEDKTAIKDKSVTLDKIYVDHYNDGWESRGRIYEEVKTKAKKAKK